MEIYSIQKLNHHCFSWWPHLSYSLRKNTPLNVLSCTISWSSFFIGESGGRVSHDQLSPLKKLLRIPRQQHLFSAWWRKNTGAAQCSSSWWSWTMGCLSATKINRKWCRGMVSRWSEHLVEGIFKSFPERWRSEKERDAPLTHYRCCTTFVKETLHNGNWEVDTFFIRQTKLAKVNQCWEIIGLN